MADVKPSDILFRAGGGTLRRLQTLVAAGAGRGVEVPYTYTRATVKRAFRDRDGTARRAAAGNMALDWPSGLVDASGNAIGGPLNEGARTQLNPNPENFGAWAVNGTPVLTSGQADPFGGTSAYRIADDDGAVNEYVAQVVGFTGDGIKCTTLFIKKDSSPPAGGSLIQLRDTTAAANRIEFILTWTGNAPSFAITSGTNMLTELCSTDNWYRTCWQTTAVTAANNNRIEIRPANQNAQTGNLLVFGSNAWNSPFPSSYQAAGESAGVADALTSPFNFGPQSDLTILVRIGRPLHADAGASTALGVSPGIFSFGAGSAARIGAYFDPAARNIISVIDTATTDGTATVAIPAGNPTICIQYKNLTSGGQTSIDTGSASSGFGSTATAFSQFSSQTARIGRYDDELYGVLGDMVVARGLFTRAEMLAIS